MQQMRATTLTLDTIEKFRSTLSGRGNSDNTIKGYSTDLRVLLKELEEKEVPMEDFEEVGQNWLQANRKRVSPKTTGRRLTSLRMFAKWAGWPVMFTEYRPPKPSKPMPHPLPEGIDGVYRLIEVASTDRQRVLLALCGLVGCRISEALKVKPTDFDFGRSLLTIHGKGDKERIVPISERCWSVICVPVTRAYLDDKIERLVPVSDRYARRAITDLGVKAGLRRAVSSHDLRATFAQEVLNHTQNMRVVQELLGHESIETTQIYTMAMLKDMQAAVEF
jgi:site-specific recombinase XerD